MKYIDYLFEIVDEDSDLCGERFFVEVLNDETAKDMAWDIAIQNFPYEKLECIGTHSPYEADAVGYDTY